MKKTLLLILALVFFVGLSGCDHKTQKEVAGKIYTYEKDGVGSDFEITINADGTFLYYEGAFSSYIGGGKWTLERDILFHSNPELTMGNYFKIDGNDLVFISENSTNFTYVKVADGERFIRSQTEGDRFWMSQSEINQ